MDNFQVNAQLVFQIAEKLQQRHGIRATGDGDEDTIAAREQMEPANCPFYVFANGHCRQKSVLIS